MKSNKYFTLIGLLLLIILSTVLHYDLFIKIGATATIYFSIFSVGGIFMYMNDNQNIMDEGATI